MSYYVESQLWQLLERLYVAANDVIEHELANDDPEARVYVANLYAVMDDVRLQLDYKHGTRTKISP